MNLFRQGDPVSQNLFRNMLPLKGQVPFNSYFYSLNANGVHFLSYSADLFSIENSSIEHDGILFDPTNAALLETQLNQIEKDLKYADENRHLVDSMIQAHNILLFNLT